MTTLTISNMPQDLYEKLEDVASRHHRSIHSEIISCLESALKDRDLSVSEKIQKAQSSAIQAFESSVPLNGTASAYRQIPKWDEPAQGDCHYWLSEN